VKRFTVQLNYKLTEWSKLKEKEKDAICKGYIDQLAVNNGFDLVDDSYHWTVMPNYSVRGNMLSILISADPQEVTNE
jgi:hypothetical protein